MLLSRFSHVWPCATPQTAAHQAPPSLGFSRQEHWSGLPFPSPMHESEKWKWSHSVVSDSSWPHGLQPTRFLHPWDFPGKSTWVGCQANGVTDWFQIGKEVRQGCILSPCLFNLYSEYIMRKSWLGEAQVGINIAGRNINNLPYADDTTLMAESEELKSLLMKLKEENETLA